MADERTIRSSLSMTPSEPSSRSESPASSTHRNYGHHKSASSASERDDTPGLHRDDAYDRMLPSWRARVRRKLVELIGVESTIIARLQVCHKNKNCTFSFKVLTFPLQEQNSYTVAGCVLCLYILAWDTYVLHDHPSGFLLLRLRRTRSWVRS